MAGDGIDGQVGALEQALSVQHALVQEPPHGGFADSCTEPAVKGSSTHMGSCRHGLHVEGRAEVLEGMGQNREHVVVNALGHGLVEVLRLGAVALWWYHHPSRDGSSRVRSDRAAYEVQTRVDAGGGAGAGEHVTFVDEERGWVDRHLGVGRGQRAGEGPVRRCASAVEQARGCHHEGAEAEPDDHGAVGMSGLQSCQHWLIRPLVRVSPGGDNDDAGGFQGIQLVGRPDLQPTGGAQRPRLGGHRLELKAVPRSGRDVGSEHAERDAHLEQRRTIEDQDRHHRRVTRHSDVPLVAESERNAACTPVPADGQKRQDGHMTTMQSSATCSVSESQFGLTLEAFGGPTVLLTVAGLRLLTDPTFDEPGEYPGEMFTLVKTAAPARSADALGTVDAVLLSHDEHADNLDDAGRRYLATVPLVLSTAGAVARLAGKTTSCPAWESLDLTGPDGSVVRVTWVPAQHGPEWATAFTGEVTGFVLTGSGLPTVYVSGDNSSLEVVRSIAERCGPVDVALLFAGAGVVAPLEAVLTVTGEEAVEASVILGARHVVVVHADGWSHFTEGHTEIEAAFERAGQRVTVMAPGEILTL